MQDLQAAPEPLADAATNYWRIGFFNQQISVSQASIAYAKTTLRLANARYQAGSISALDVVNAEQNLLAQERSLLALQHDRQQALNEQAVLLGAPSGQATIAPVRRRRRRCRRSTPAFLRGPEPSPGSQRSRAAVARRPGQRR